MNEVLLEIRIRINSIFWLHYLGISTVVHNKMYIPLYEGESILHPYLLYWSINLYPQNQKYWRQTIIEQM